MQEGVVGLLRALERYDVERGTPFWVYASFWVRQAMQQVVSELSRPVVLSDRALRQLARVKNAHREHMQAHHREPSTTEVAERTGFTREQVESLVAVDRAPRGLEERLGDADSATFGDLIPDAHAEDEYDAVAGRVDVEALRHLPGVLCDRERSILRARFGADGPEQTLREIGGHLGLSAERVRQIEERALDKLRARCAA
jgi:RNA polymerase sigma factor (sigma-70 family)